MAHTGEKSNAYRVLMGKPGGKGRFERPRHNFESVLEKEDGFRFRIDLASDREE
jgi:hypothetical protein